MTCGEGSLHRKVLCYVGEEEVIETKCDHEKKPISKIACHRASCPRWMTEPWGEVDILSVDASFTCKPKHLCIICVQYILLSTESLALYYS